MKHLRDVTVATFGAYPAASVELRTRNNDGAEERQRGRAMAEEANKEGGLQVEDRHERSEDNEARSYPAASLRVENGTVDADVRFRSLAELYGDRGFFENRVAQIGFDEFRSFTWAAGTVLDNLNPLRTQGVPYGYDRRWLYPILPTTSVSDATTAVQYLRQSARTLAGTAVISRRRARRSSSRCSNSSRWRRSRKTSRPSMPLSRCSRASSNRTCGCRSGRRLGRGRAARHRPGRDDRQGTDDILEVTGKAMTLVEAEGYNPDTLAIDPAGA